jgi:hypothetical protein
MTSIFSISLEIWNFYSLPSVGFGPNVVDGLKTSLLPETELPPPLAACSGPRSAERIMASGQVTAPHQQAEHMAAPTSSASPFKKALANREPSTHGYKKKSVGQP